MVKISDSFGVTSGIAGAAYTEAARINAHGCGAQGKFLAFLKNTHGTSTIYYKVDLYLGPLDITGQLTKVGKAETSIAANTQIEITTTEVPFNAIIVISVKQNSAEGTYTLNWTTY